jgi:nitroreductase
MDQAQITEASTTVVFVADPRCWPITYDEVLTLGVRTGALTSDRANYYRKMVGLFFTTGPWGMLGPFKRAYLALRSLFKPTPFAISSARDASVYVRAQTMLTAATFMIAAKSAGIDSSPMEGFDERRVKELLKIPSYMSVPIIVALGYLDESDTTPMSVRLPLTRKVSMNYFGNLISGEMGDKR